MTSGPDYFYTLQEICVLLNLLPNTFRQIAREYSDLVAVSEQVRKGRTVLGLPREDFEVLRAVVEMRSQGLPAEEIRARVRHPAGSLTASAPGVPSPPVGDDRHDPPRRNLALYGEATAPVESLTSLERFLGLEQGEEPGPETAATDDSQEEGRVGDEVAAGSDAPAATTAGVFPDQPSPGAARMGAMDDDETGEEGALQAEIAALREELKKMDESRKEERDRLLVALLRTQHELQGLRYEVGASLSRRDRKKKRGFWGWLFDL